MKTARLKWTEPERAVIQDMYPSAKMEDILAALPGRTYKAITLQARLMGVGRSKDIMREWGKAVQQHPNSIANRFKKGNIPVNKGSKMSKDIYDRCAHTMFKKGNIPHNTKEKNGIVTVRLHKGSQKFYKWVRVELNKWKQLHRVVWEAEYGVIEDPINYIVVFKDGDTLNCELDNLELISRAENMRRNSVQNYPEQVKKLIRIKQGFSKRLTTITKKHEYSSKN